MVTIKQIYKHLNTFANDHLQINSYHFGMFYDINTSGTTSYPIMAVQPEGSEVRKGQMMYSFTIAVADLVQKGDGDWVDILNETQRVASDIVTEIRQGGMGHSYDWQMEEGVTMTSFKERWDDEVAGWSFRVTINTDFDYNRCAIPTTGSTSGGILQDADGEYLEI